MASELWRADVAGVLRAAGSRMCENGPNGDRVLGYMLNFRGVIGVGLLGLPAGARAGL